MRKFLNKRNVLIGILLVFAFFTVFKYFKGKSFFDTIVEYSNDIHSQNSIVTEVSSKDYADKKLAYMPIKYIDYGEFSNQKHIVTIQGSKNIYIYDSYKNEEILFQEIDGNSQVQNIIVNNYWVIWVENIKLKTENNLTSYEWKIYGKSLKETKKFLIDSGQFESDSNGIADERILYPDEFDIDGNIFVYRKYVRKTEKNGNIISDRTVNGIVMCDLSKNSIYMIDNSSDINRDIVYSPKVYANKIIWGKARLNPTNSSINSSEVYMYNTDDKVIKKIYETSNVKYIDINGENVVIILNNPDDNVIILNLNTGIQTNILYKGSRAEKYVANDSSKIDITGVKFVTSNNILINFATENEELSSLVYNIKKDEFYNLNNDVKSNIEYYDGINYVVNDYKIKAYVGLIEKEIVEKETNDDNEFEEKSISEINIYDENGEILEEYKNNIFYKYYTYQMK